MDVPCFELSARYATCLALAAKRRALRAELSLAFVNCLHEQTTPRVEAFEHRKMCADTRPHSNGGGLQRLSDLVALSSGR